MDYAREMIYLAGCAVNGVAPDKSRVEGVDIERLMRFAKAHMISAIVAHGLLSAGVKNDSLTQAEAKAMRRAVILEAEYAKLSDAFESAGVWHVPLKGTVLKGCYPAFWMREMSDIDILFDGPRQYDVREIMRGLGFKVKDFGTFHHDVYCKPPALNVEMHHELFGSWPDPLLYEYYSAITDKLLPDDGKKYARHLSPEDFYVYMTAHAYKHYSDYGTGIRSVVDSYMYLRKFSGVLDMEYISREAMKLGISEFEAGMRSLAVNLFGGGKLTAENESMLEYIISSGIYGTVDHSIMNAMKKNGGGMSGKMKYILGKVFPPFEKLKARYPFYYKHKYLYPVFVVCQLVKNLIMKRKTIASALRALFG